MSEVTWRKCSSCKKDIPTRSIYYVCSVSSCSRKSAPVQFCSFDCWSVHNEVYNHRNAAAIEETAPAVPDSNPSPASAAAVPKSTAATRSTAPGAAVSASTETDILVVVSKVKKYIQDQGSLSTSADVFPALTQVLTRICDSAAKNAAKDGRKTLMARDIPRVDLH